MIDKEYVLDQLYREQGFKAVYLELATKQDVGWEEVYASPIEIACIYLMAGEHEKALDWLDKGYERRDQSMP